ncbi:MAG TPA: endonuclease domain-containing protein [Burkholderiales bacterium]|nr:endonuclease domain-containing protein [Burkholderiales bacterium]
MARRPFHPYRCDLKPRSQSLRRDPSPAERKLWFEFLRDLPAKFTRQKPLGHYIADFYCASQRLVIEVDGDSHFSDEGGRYDAARTANLERDGIRVMRVTNLEVMVQFEGVCQRIQDALKRSP